MPSHVLLFGPQTPGPGLRRTSTSQPHDKADPQQRRQFRRRHKPRNIHNLRTSNPLIAYSLGL